MIGLQFRDQVTRVSQAVADEFQQLVSGIRGYLFKEHKDDGSHGDVTADSLTINPEGRLLFAGDAALGKGDATISNDGTGIITLNGPGEFVIERGGEEQAAFGRSTVDQGLEQQFQNKTSIQGALKLFGQGDYNVPFADGAALQDTLFGPSYSVYRLTASGDHTIYGIYTLNVAPGGGARGQVIVLFNDDTVNITFSSTLVTDGQRLFGCAPAITIPPKGSIVFVYDILRRGWHFVCAAGQTPIAYTPVWASSGTQPALGNGSLTGSWRQVGPMVHIDITLGIGTLTTFGTGEWTFSLPVDGVINQTGAALYSHGAAVVPSNWLINASTSSLRLFSGGGAFDVTTPVAWGSGDTIWISGAYLRA